MQASPWVPGLPWASWPSWPELGWRLPLEPVGAFQLDSVREWVSA